MRAPRVGPWGPKVHGGSAARGAPGVAVEPVSCGVMDSVPPRGGGRGQAASVHIRSGGRDRQAKCATATARRCGGSHEWRPSGVGAGRNRQHHQSASAVRPGTARRARPRPRPLRALADQHVSRRGAGHGADRTGGLLARLTTATSPTLCEGFGVGAHTAAELLIIFGDNPDRIRSEAAFAKLCGACPIPASSGMTTGRHRLNRGGHRHANAALYRAVIVRMQFHQPTRDYVARRIAAGRTKRDIIRCLKRFLAREIYQRVMTDFRTRQAVTQAA